MTLCSKQLWRCRACRACGAISILASPAAFRHGTCVTHEESLLNSPLQLPDNHAPFQSELDVRHMQFICSELHHLPSLTMLNVHSSQLVAFFIQKRSMTDTLDPGRGEPLLHKLSSLPSLSSLSLSGLPAFAIKYRLNLSFSDEPHRMLAPFRWPSSLLASFTSFGSLRLETKC